MGQINCESVCFLSMVVGQRTDEESVVAVLRRRDALEVGLDGGADGSATWEANLGSETRTQPWTSAPRIAHQSHECGIMLLLGSHELRAPEDACDEFAVSESLAFHPVGTAPIMSMVSFSRRLCVR